MPILDLKCSKSKARVILQVFISKSNKCTKSPPYKKVAFGTGLQLAGLVVFGQCWSTNVPSAPQQCRPQQTRHQNPLQSADVVGSQAAKYSWQHQLQGVLEFDRVHFANESIVV